MHDYLIELSKEKNIVFSCSYVFIEWYIYIYIRVYIYTSIHRHGLLEKEKKIAIALRELTSSIRGRFWRAWK